MTDISSDLTIDPRRKARHREELRKNLYVAAGFATWYYKNHLSPSVCLSVCVPLCIASLRIPSAYFTQGLAHGRCSTHLD